MISGDKKSDAKIIWQLKPDLTSSTKVTLTTIIEYKKVRLIIMGSEYFYLTIKKEK